jgi:hypothetical protein
MERENATPLLPSHWVSSPIFWSLSIFGLGFLLRMLVLYFVEPYGLGYDENFYIGNAQRYASGGAFTNKFYMPGWPWMLSFFARIDDSVFFLRHAPVLFGSITPVLFYHLGNRIFDHRTGIVAGIALAIFPDHLLYSHHLYAETALEMLIVGVTLFAFWERPWTDRPLRDAISCALFGVVLLVKHFVVLAVGGFLLSRSYPRRRWLLTAAVAAAFFIPVFLQGAYFGVTGRDPFMIFNSPLKSVGEWGPVQMRAAAFTPGVNRVEKITNHIKWLFKVRRLQDNWWSFHNNLDRIWSPGTYGLRRLLTNYYSISPGNWLVWMNVVFYSVVLFLGVTGIAFGDANNFRRYCVVTCVLLSLMAAAWFMMSRYRYPFMFPFFLYGANLVTQWDKYRRDIKRSRWPTRLGWVAAMAFFIHVFVHRVTHLAEYQ